MKPLKAFARLWRAVDPRHSVAARLLFFFFAAFLIPVTVFVFLLERRLTDLQGRSVKPLVAVRREHASVQIRQDASFRAGWMDQRAAVSEEAAWSLANAVKQALDSEVVLPESPLPRHEDGYIWNPNPNDDSVAFITPASSEDPHARQDYLRAAPWRPC